MTIFDLLNEALLLSGNLQRATEATGRGEESDLWQHLREHWNFTVMTGQAYVFEDYLAGLDAARTSYVSTAFNARADAVSKQTMAMLLRTLDEMAEPERKRGLLTLINLLNFVAVNQQPEALANFSRDIRSGPPPVIAFFDTREEAEAWLNRLTAPPSYGHVMIGDEYYRVWYSREDNVRELPRDYLIEYFLDAFESKPPPLPVASFNTREEAMAWLANHPASPTVLVTIAGEYYHAVYYKKFNRHTLHSLSSLREWRRQMKAQMEQQKKEEAEPSEE